MNNLGVAQGTLKINTSDLKNADIALRSAGGSMINFGMQAVGAFAAIVGEAAKFEKEMDFVQAVTNASEEEMKALQDAAIELGKKSIYGPVQLSQAFVELAKAGASVEQIIGGVGEASVNLATAADVEIPFAGENLINILNTFKLGAEDAVHVSDLLAGAANASSVELTDIVTTMRYAGPVAQAMGISLEEVNQALTVLGRVGIKGSTAGTSLRFAMTRLVPDTEKAVTAIEGLGLHIDEATGSVVEFSNTDGSLKDLAQVFQVLQDATKGLNDQQKIAVINDIFGVRAMPSVLELMNAGADGFAELNAEIERTTAADVAAKRMDNLDGSIKRLKATLSAIMVDAGGPFQTMVKDWVDGLRDLLIAFDELPDPIKKFLVGSLLGVGVLSLFAGGILLTIGNMVRAARVIGEIANAFGFLAGGMGKLIKATGLLNTALLASPWFWLIVLIIAVIAAFVLLWMKSEAFREFWKGLWEDIKKIAQDVAEWFVGAWDAVSDFFGDWEQWWGKIKEGASAAWDAVKGFVGDIVGAIAEFASGVWDDIAGAVTGAWDAVAGFFSDIGGWFADLPGLMGGYAEEAVDWVVDAFKRLSWNNIGHAIGKAIGTYLRYAFYEIPKFVGEALAKAVQKLWEWRNQAVNWMADMKFKLIDWAGGTWSSIWNTIKGWISTIKDEVLQFLVDIVLFFWQKVPEWAAAAYALGLNVWNAIVNWIKGLPAAIKGFFAQIVADLWAKKDEIWNAAKSIGESIYNGIIDFVTDIPGAVWGFITDAVNIIKNAVGTAWDAAWDFGNGIWDGFWDGISGSPHSKIEYALWDIQDTATDTLSHLNRTLSSMNRMSATIPVTGGSAVMGYGNGATTNFNQYGPLIGAAVVRDDSDIDLIAKRLDERQRDKLASVGRRVLVGTVG